MTPQEIFEYKQGWKPGHTVRLHSDLADTGKTWCRRGLERQTWSMTEWTGAYEHTFHFEDPVAAQNFAMEFSNWVNQ
jgi:hypothetical protein